MENTNNEQVTTGFLVMNVKRATSRIKSNIKTKSDKAAGAFKTAVDGFSKLIAVAEEKIKFIKDEKAKRLNEVKILESTIVDLERQKMKNYIIETRLLSLLEVSDEEVDKQLGIIKPDMMSRGISAKKSTTKKK